MYDLVNNLIEHEWVSNYAGEQSYIYYICGTLICLLSVVVIDMVYRLMRSLIKRGHTND